jgi:hypothetical protein
MFEAATLARQLDTDSASLAQLALPTTKDTIVTKRLAPLFEGPGKYLSVEEKYKARRAADGEYDAEVSADLADLNQLVRDSEPQLAAAIRDAEQLPSTTLGRWLATKRTSSHTAEEWLLCDVRAELIRSRLTAEMATAPASLVHRRYDAAAAEGDIETLSFIEDRIAAGWTPPKSDDEAEISAAVGLRKTIAATRAARVPHELRALEQSITNTRRLLDKIKTAKPGGHARTRG